MVRWLAALAAMIILALPAWATEEITRFDSDITINRDSSLDVVEHIAVNAEGRMIQRGIFRDFPTRYKDRMGNPVRINFDVTSVKRDGKPENYVLEDIANGTRIRIGNRDVMLKPGPHVYDIAYHVGQELGFFDQFDELYWNVTGNSWTLPITSASVTIALPQGATLVQHAEYTGPQGAQGRDFRVTSASGSTYAAETTRRLMPGEGFTVAVAFPKGAVTPPPPPPDTRLESYEWLGGGLAALFAYYLAAWFRVGRDPKRGTIIPLYDAPAGLGPAGVRFIWKRVFDAKSFAAGVIGLAAKGRLTIAQKDGTYSLTRLKASTPPLTASEQAMFGALPAEVDVARGNAEALSTMRHKLESSLERDYEDRTYRRNRGWFWGGLALSAFLAVPLLMFVDADDFTTALLLTVVCGGIWAAVLLLGRLNARFFRKSGFIGKLVSLIGFAALALIALFGFALALGFVGDGAGEAVWFYAAGLAAFALLHITFFRLLPAETSLGRKLMDQVEGLRLYMTTAEEKRLDALNPPEKTPALFEKLLPYAVALDCENAWSEKFADVLKAASYVAPAWYAASMGNGFGNFTSDLNRSSYAPPSPSTYSTSSSSWSPGSFSGSGGGGSSGGGGGGGGGGGW